MGILLKKHRYEPPAAASFPLLRGTDSVSPTLTGTSDRGLVFDFGAYPSSGDRCRMAGKAKPAGTDYSIRARLEPLLVGGEYRASGLYVGDGTKLVLFGQSVGDYSRLEVRVTRFNSQTSFNSNPQVLRCPIQPEWFRIDVVGGVPRDFMLSRNGDDWMTFLSQDQSSFLTFTEVGFAHHVYNSGVASGTNAATMSVMYYSDPDIVPAS